MLHACSISAPTGIGLLGAYCEGPYVALESGHIGSPDDGLWLRLYAFSEPVFVDIERHAARLRASSEELSEPIPSQDPVQPCQDRSFLLAVSVRIAPECNTLARGVALRAWHLPFY